MNIKKIRQLFILVLLINVINTSFSQEIWPGDVNNNGIVNGVDLLYLGVAYDSEGEERSGATTTWIGQILGELWSQSFANGINYAYADCDGDGEVDEDDIVDAIIPNFALTHGVVTPDVYSAGVAGIDPAISLMPQNSSIQIGEAAIFDLWIGNVEAPVQDFYGIAFELEYNPDFIFSGTWEFEEISNVWYAPDGNDDHEKLFIVDEGAGKMELAITRTNQQNITGAGKIGTLSIVIEDIIFAMGNDSDTLNLSIKNVRMISKDLGTLPVVADSTFIIISKKVDQTSNLQNTSNVKVFPNPIKDIFTITSDDEIISVELIDIRGQNIPLSINVDANYNTKKIIINNSKKLQSQLCLLKIYTTKGLVIKKIIIP